MFTHNTTYVVPNADARDFVIWVHQVLLPRAEASAEVGQGRLSRILSHKEEDSECFSVQLSAPTTAALHRWVVLGFSTLMEVIDGE